MSVAHPGSDAPAAAPGGIGSPRSVLLVSRNLRGAGSQRMVVLLATHLDRRRFRPALVLFSRRGEFLARVPPDVPLHDLGEGGRVTMALSVARLRRLVRTLEPDLVVTFQKYPSLAALGVARSLARPPRVVVSEQVHVSENLAGTRLGGLKRLLHRALYPCAQGIVAVSRGVQEDLRRRFGAPPALVRVIHNACDVAEVARRAGDAPDVDLDWQCPTVIAVGRLARQKGLPDLLRAFASVARARPCRLLVLGEGEAREDLLREAAALGIQERVLLLGFRANPFAYMRRSRVLVLSSLWEGFPHVLLEAMACGTPVVSTDCPSGPGEIIAHGVNGLLVPVRDPAALAGALLQVLDSESLRDRLARAGLARARQFAPDVIVPQYEDAFSAALAGTFGAEAGRV